MTGTTLAAAHGTNYTAISITLGILFIIGAVDRRGGGLLLPAAGPPR